MKNTYYRLFEMSRPVVLIIMMLACFMSSTTYTVGQVLNEDQLKANYILGFKDFIHWDRKEKRPLVIGIVGEGHFMQAMQENVRRRNQSAGTEVFTVVQIDSANDMEGVDILYFSDNSEASWKPFLERACDEGILTIADGSGFLKAGGLISFEIRKNRLHFRLNHENSEECGIKFSSKLAKLAIS